jgi:hypothetical protein
VRLWVDRREHVRALGRGRACVYVLPCRDEDILKLGFSREPLRRMQTLHRRYFEFFDLDRAFIIHTEAVRDARRLERQLARTVAAHQAPAPLLVPKSAAGHTEWYRGAYAPLAQAAAAVQQEAGYELTSPLRAWLRRQLQAEAGRLYDWSARVLDAIQLAAADPEARAAERWLQDTLDAFGSVNIGVDSHLSAGVLGWYRARATPPR